MADTAIEWADAVWNPTTGCDKVSPGCDNCYALTMAKRLKGMGQAKYQTDGDPRTSGPGFGLAMHDDALDLPLHWRKPRRIFVNSMSDLFHPRVTDEFIARVFAVMAATPQHTYQVLTKRAPRMQSFVTDECRCGKGHAPSVHLRSAMDWAATPHNPSYVPGLTSTYHTAPWPLPNVWLGVSVENQEQADARVPRLVDTPAAVRWLSCEPLLGPVDLGAWLVDHGEPGRQGGIPIDWVVVGGESGHRARPMHPVWARRLRDQCVSARVPFFFKQWGEWGTAPWRIDREPGEDVEAYKAQAEATCATHAYAAWAHLYGHEPYQAPYKPWSLERTSLDESQQAPIRRWGKHVAGRELDGRTWDEHPTAVPAC